MRKLLTVLLALALVIASIPAMAEEETLKLSVMCPDFKADKDWVTLEEGNPILQKLKELSGVELEFVWVPNSTYGDILSTVLADPDNLPDLLVMTGARDAIMINTARSGAFWDLTDYIDNYEYLAAGSDVSYNNIAIDGRIYGVYRTRPVARNGIYYRYDVASAVGYTEAPQTMDDFTEMSYEMLSYIKENYGETAYLLNCCQYIAGTINIFGVMFGGPNAWGIAESGDLYPAFEDEKYQQGLDWLRDLYAAGGINPDFMTIPSSDWDTIERTDKCFMRSDCLDNCYRQQEYFTKTVENGGLGRDNTVRWFQPLPNVENADGERRMYPTAGIAGEVVITKHVETEEKMLKVLSFLNWCNSADGQLLLNHGMEGINFSFDENGYRVVEGVDTTYTDTVFHSINQFGSMMVNGDLTPPLATAATTYRLEYTQGLVNNLGYCIANPAYSLTSETYTMVGTTLDKAIEDAQVQYIAGQLSYEQLLDAYTQWHVNGGDSIIAEYTEQYEAFFG